MSAQLLGADQVRLAVLHGPVSPVQAAPARTRLAAQVFISSAIAAAAAAASADAEHSAQPVFDTCQCQPSVQAATTQILGTLKAADV